MQRHAFWTFAIAMLAATVLCSGCKWGHSPMPTLFGPSGLAKLEMTVLNAVNGLRREQGLEPLAYDSQLREMARHHSHDMAEREVLTHRDVNGLYVASRATRARIDWLKVAENVARVKGYEKPAEQAVRDWLKSPGHRANILHPEFVHTGVGIVKGDDEYYYFTQIFLLRMPE